MTPLLLTITFATALKLPRLEHREAIAAMAHGPRLEQRDRIHAALYERMKRCGRVK